MPLKMSKKGGGTKSVTYNQGVADLKKKGYSEESARKIMGTIQAKQEHTGKYKKKK
jgi:hypothetical protein